MKQKHYSKFYSNVSKNTTVNTIARKNDIVNTTIEYSLQKHYSKNTEYYNSQKHYINHYSIYYCFIY
jgi:hypothetical protein